MTGTILSSPSNALPAIAKAFERSRVVEMRVWEEGAFSGAGDLSLGTIELFPEEGEEQITKAVRKGAFEWKTPEIDAVQAELVQLLSLGDLKGDAKKNTDDKLRRLLDSFGAIPIRLGMTHPAFDPRSLEAMPFKRPTTVVADTSGVLQGGLNFIGRYLHPAARIKIPAVVQMEIVNLAERFFSNKRSSKPRALDLLFDHTRSQGGQRVLLQLELHTDVELERTFLLGDPLRGTFQREEEKELKELNLSVPIRAYADRLILEAVRQHQTQVSHGHPMMLLTSDQGLARMALAEGVTPLYFKSAKAGALFGRHFTGVNFHPFKGSLSTISVADLIWELATDFGCARLRTPDGSYEVSVYAMGKEFAWAPYHSHDDLLWIEITVSDEESAGSRGVGLSATDSSEATQASEKPAKRAKKSKAASASDTAIANTDVQPVEGTKAIAETPALYKFSVDRMLTLVEALDAHQRLSVDEVSNALGIPSKSGVVDYRRFLESGNAVSVDDDGWTATPALSRLAIALRNADVADLRAALSHFPSYIFLDAQLSGYPIGEPVPAAVFGRAASTFTALAEITQLGASVFGEGFFPTPTDPIDTEFAEMAAVAYDRLDEGGEWVETGRWLEELVKGFGVHPLVARARLQTAAEKNLVRRFAEGSTTDTKLDRHAIRVLSSKDGRPAIRTQHLYRGDFLIPGKGSSSLRIERIRP
ncbi:MAG: hypothetical protein ABJG86_06235 [Nitratireductor sp.]|uniref:hypothetical protein n=1 Tax=Parvibaculum sp. TaxID=2024848 RepID=UPI003274E76A